MKRLSRIVRRRTGLSHATSWSSTFRALVIASAPDVEGNRQKIQLQVPARFEAAGAPKNTQNRSQPSSRGAALESSCLQIAVSHLHGLGDAVKPAKALDDNHFGLADDFHGSAKKDECQEGYNSRNDQPKSLEIPDGVEKLRQAGRSVDPGDCPRASNQRRRGSFRWVWRRADWRPRRASSHPG